MSELHDECRLSGKAFAGTIMFTVLTYSIVLAVGYLVLAATVAIVAALRAGGRREEPGEQHEALAVSRFTIPVSIIVPITRRTGAISQALSRLLNLNYPEFEVIVVADGAPRIVEALAREWQIEAREFFYRKTIETAEVHRIYRSGRDPRLMVIDKMAAGYSDALNCGINVARYRYCMSIDPDVTFDRDALLRLMAAALRDPANVVGATNHVEQGAESEGYSSVTALFRRLASARSLMDSRLAWRRLGAGLGPEGAVTVWRRDAVITRNGFSASAADADLDMMLRMQRRGAESAGRFDRGQHFFGRVGPQTVRGSFRQAGRRQLAALEIVAAWVRGRAVGFDARALTYFVGSEFVTPLAQAWVMVATTAGAFLGWFSWSAVVFAILLLSFGNAVVNNGALLLRGATAGAAEGSELRWLVIAGPFDFLCHRSVLAAARVLTLLRFVTGTANTTRVLN